MQAHYMQLIIMPEVKYKACISKPFQFDRQH
jgi:hypothetical protein